MISFCVGKLKITIDIGFLTVIALVSMSGENCIAAFSACVIHEIGHIIQILLCGYRTEKIICSISGVKIITSSGRVHSVYEELGVITGGVTANIAAAGIMFAVNGGKPDIFIVTNIILAIFNLLPYSCLDGGSAIRTVVEYTVVCQRQNTILKAVGIFNIISTIIACYFLRNLLMINISAIIIFIYIIIMEICALFKIIID